MRELKDQLCTLLITFSDWDGPNKEVTTAHTFASTDPGTYPQHRQVVHSRQTTMAEDHKAKGDDALLRREQQIERISQSAFSTPLGAILGSDMVEHRRFLSSPIPTVQQQHLRFLHSPPVEKPTEETSGQLRHSSTSNSSPTSPLNSVINIHEVSLSYSPPNSSDHTQAVALSVPDRRSLSATNLTVGSAHSTTFPSSGIVQMHISEGIPGDGRLLYSVGRPEADWNFGSGEVIKISDSSDQSDPKKRHGHMPPMAMATKQKPEKQKQRFMNKESEDKHWLHQTTTRMMRGSGGGGGADQMMIRNSLPPLGPPPMPLPPFSSHHRQQRPILSHYQTRSFENNEESKMSKHRAKGKSRTIFEKTSCELFTENSITTYGAARLSAADPHQQQQQPTATARLVRVGPNQQKRGLPRFRLEDMTDVHVYTRCDDGEPGKKEEFMGRNIQPKKRVLEKEEHVLEKEEMIRTTRSWKEPKHGTEKKTGGTEEVHGKSPMVSPIIVHSDQTKLVTKEQKEDEGRTRRQPTRLIDFETYKREVEELKRQAAEMEGTGRWTESGKNGMIPLAPAVVIAPKEQPMVLPKASVATELKYFGSDQNDGMMKRRKTDKDEEEEQKRKKAEELKREEKRRRMIEEEQRYREERMRRMEEEERMMEVRRKRDDDAYRDRAKKEAHEREEERRKKKKLEEEERRKWKDWEEKEQLKREVPPLIRPQPLYVLTSSEIIHTVEVRRRMRSPKGEIREELRTVSIPPITMLKRAIPVERRGEKGRAEPMMKKEEEEPMNNKLEEERGGGGGRGGHEDGEEEGMVEYELETGGSRNIGKHLLETLRRELQYEEEVDMEVKKRKRGQMKTKDDDGREEDEEAEEDVEEEDAEEEERRAEEIQIGEKQPEAEEEEEQTPSLEVPPSDFVPIHFSGTANKLASISGELSLPTVKEEEEDEEATFEEEEVIETNSSVHTLNSSAGPKRPPPPPPPPKPAHTVFGASRGTTPSEPPRYRDSSSFSSAYSYFPPTPTMYNTNTMEYSSPASSDYRSAISSSRPRFVPRPPRPLSPTGPRVLKMVSESSSVSSRPMSPFPGSIAASAVRDAREREKKAISELNDRLANYIEKVRFLEAQNRKLATDLDFLRNRWGRDATNLREMYETDLRQAKKVLEDTQRQKEELEQKAKTLADEIEALKKKNDEALRAHEEDKQLMEALLLKLAALEAELAALKRRLDILEEDMKPLKRENQRLSREMQKARTDLDQETLNRIDYQNQVQMLLEEIDFLRRAHDAEIQDLQALAARDTTGENREYFRNELASAIRDIRTDYDAMNNRNRTDIESWYKLKVQEIQTRSARQNMEQNYAKEEVKRLRTQLNDLRGKLADLEGRNSLLEKQAEELSYQLEDDQRAYESALNEKDEQIRKVRDEAQALMVELQVLLDTKQTLDAEIAIYRRMLEGEEDRSGLQQLVEKVIRTDGIRQQNETETQRVVRGEKSSRQSYQRSAKGNVSILETSPEGKYVVLENTHRSKEEPIGQWKLKRRIDDKSEIEYTFPRDFVLRPGKTVKVWANGIGIHMPPDQLMHDAVDSFGVGSNVQTILYNRDGEERASLVQRSSGR